MSPGEPIDAGPASAGGRWSWPKRVVVAVVVVVGAALVAGLGLVGYRWLNVPEDELDPLLPGGLTVSAATPAVPMSLGPFHVRVDSGQQAGVTVTQAGKVVWRSDPGTAFVAASVGSVSFTDHLGSFWPRVTRDVRLTDQSIASVSAGDDSVVFSGVLSGGAETAEYEMELTPLQGAEGSALGIDVTVSRTHSGASVNSTLLASGRAPGERIQGLGEQCRPFDLSGTVVPILPREQGIGRGERPITFLADVTNWAGGSLATTYSARPSYVTSANRR